MANEADLVRELYRKAGTKLSIVPFDYHGPLYDPREPTILRTAGEGSYTHELAHRIVASELALGFPNYGLGRNAAISMAWTPGDEESFEHKVAYSLEASDEWHKAEIRAWVLDFFLVWEVLGRSGSHLGDRNSELYSGEGVEALTWLYSEGLVDTLTYRWTRRVRAQYPEQGIIDPL